MKTIRLSKEQKIFIKSIVKLNDKRDYVQNLVFSSLVSNTSNKMIIAALAPRMGKTRVTKLLLEALNKRFEGNHLIIVPTLIIKEEFGKFLKECGINNVILSTHSGVFSVRFNREEEFLSIIYDEADFGVSSNKSVLWTKCLDLKSRWKMCLSGTFGWDNLQLLEKKGFDVIFDIDINDGVLIGTLPSFDVYNLGVELSDKEKKEYTILNTKSEALLMPYRQMFPLGDTCLHAISTITFGKQFIKIGSDARSGDDWMKVLMKFTGWDAGVLLGRKKNYNLYRIKMDAIVENSENKVKIVNEIVNKFVNERGIIFTKRTETCDELALMNTNIIAYHSNSVEKNILELFRNKSKNVIASVNKISRGFTESGISYAINSNYNATSNDYIQKISRTLSMEEGSTKNPFIINLYCKEYTENAMVITPKDFKRLKKAQENTLVDWIDNLEQI